MASTEPVAAASTGTKKPSIVGGILPLIGVLLFVAVTAIQFATGPSADWGRQILINGIVYMVGWAGIGAGISHVFFGQRISRTIGFAKSPYELEVGFSDLAMGMAGVLAASFSSDYWLALILVSTVYRVGCGIGHLRSMIQDKNFAINNTAILFTDFVVPAFLVVAYSAWA